jgi:hypothetical protein
MSEYAFTWMGADVVVVARSPGAARNKLARALKAAGHPGPFQRCRSEVRAKGPGR